ncbi:MAG: hypothetical protein U5M23_15245 [Marinagarivorans sp.]|nr:hypothetical protein [Marinagarivorans sp.]
MAVQRVLDGEKAAAVARSYGLGDRTIYVCFRFSGNFAVVIHQQQRLDVGERTNRQQAVLHTIGERHIRIDYHWRCYAGGDDFEAIESRPQVLQVVGKRRECRIANRWRHAVISKKYQTAGALADA